MKDDLLTPEQKIRFGRICGNCGKPYGEHSCFNAACPDELGRVFSAPAADILPPNDCRKPPARVGPDTGLVGRICTWTPRAALGTKTGKIVEVVPAGKLPTTAGLRHIADKRRMPKPRAEESYVVTTASPGTTPTRNNLFWPEAINLV